MPSSKVHLHQSTDPLRSCGKIPPLSKILYPPLFLRNVCILYPITCSFFRFIYSDFPIYTFIFHFYIHDFSKKKIAEFIQHQILSRSMFGENSQELWINHWKHIPFHFAKRMQIPLRGQGGRKKGDLKVILQKLRVLDTYIIKRVAPSPN